MTKILRNEFNEYTKLHQHHILKLFIKNSICTLKNIQYKREQGSSNIIHI